MPVACPSSRVTTARRGMAGGCAVRHAPVRAYSLARPCRAVAPWASCPAPRACGESGTRPGAFVQAQHGRARRVRRWGGRVRHPRGSVASWASRVGVPRAAAGVRRCGGPPTACPPPGAAAAAVPDVRSPSGVASGSRRGWELGARRWYACRVRRRGPVRCRPADVSPCAGSGGLAPRVAVERTPHRSRAEGVGAPC